MWTDLEAEVLEEFVCSSEVSKFLAAHQDGMLGEFHTLSVRLWLGDRSPEAKKLCVERELHKKREATRKRKLAAPRKCEGCGADITFRLASARYCGHVCGDRHRRLLASPASDKRVCGNPSCGADISHKNAGAQVCSNTCRYHFKKHLEKMRVAS